MLSASEFLICCVIDGVLFYYNHGVFGPRLEAVRFSESQLEQVREILTWLRKRGYLVKLVRVRVHIMGGTVASASIPIADDRSV